jgi:hypothetical protein
MTRRVAVPLAGVAATTDDDAVGVDDGADSARSSACSISCSYVTR